MPSLLSIQKRILQEEHLKTPLGQVEQQLKKFYNKLKASGEKLPEDVSKKIFDLRDETNKWVENYINETNKQHKEDIDNKLLESQTKELEIINNHQKGTNSTNA